MKLTLEDILKATGGRLASSATEDVVRGVSTDSRTIQPGDLFIALKGDRHDGHQYLGDAFDKGASGAIVQEGFESVPDGAKAGFKNIVEVSDTLKALGDLARFWRRRFDVPVVAITGSNGKTTA